MNKFTSLLFTFSLIVTFFVTSNAQTTANLKIDKSIKGVIGFSLFCDKDYNCGLRENETSKFEEFEENKNLFLKVQRTKNDFYFQINTKLDKKIINGKKTLLNQGANIIIDVKIPLSNNSFSVIPFKVSHNKSDKKGMIIDQFFISPNYAAKGVLTYKNCSSEIILHDMNFDGKFSDSDAKRGTNLGIDFNKDDKFWGKDEFKKTDEIIEFCGQRFLISDLNSQSITFEPTDIKLAKVGEPVPDFSFSLLNNEIITSEKIKGKPFILDFWASWCSPCVKNLSKIAELENTFKNKLSVYSINIDEKENRDLAEKIINEKKIYDFSVIREMGDKDLLWKSFGYTVHFIPAYILVDKDGIVRYANSGGDNLKDLKDKIAELKLEN